MTLNNVAILRTQNHQLSDSKFKDAKKLVGWMGAMQAQDFAMAKWAVGIRLPNSTEQMIDAAIDKGGIIRTHLLRPTWHFVSSDDVHWILKLTAPQIKARLKSRHKALGITDALLAKCYKLIEEMFIEKPNIKRAEFVGQFEKAKIKNEDNRASHILLFAELDGLICSGKIENGDPTYALLQQRVAKTKLFNREESMAKLASKYFISHGPATMEDFVWWAGLSVKDAKRALESVKSKLVMIKINSTEYWMTSNSAPVKQAKDIVHLLPAYDELIVSYRDRSASLTSENHKKAISSNGLFRPVIISNGQAAGLWSRNSKKDKVLIHAEIFKTADSVSHKLLGNAVKKFGHFLNKPVEINSAEKSSSK